MSNTATQVVALFGAGVASFLAPCIVPLVPAYLGIIVGEIGDAHDPARAVPATLLFIAGFTTVFAGLGATAGFLGSSLSTFQSTVRVGGGIVIIVMGLALLGALRGPLAASAGSSRRCPRSPALRVPTSSASRSAPAGARASGHSSPRH